MAQDAFFATALCFIRLADVENVQIISHLFIIILQGSNNKFLVTKSVGLKLTGKIYQLLKRAVVFLGLLK